MAILWIEVLPHGEESENKKRPHRRAYCADKTRRLFVFFVAQRDDQHVDMNGVNQLAGRGHQLAPEVLMMAADHQVHIVFLIASTST